MKKEIVSLQSATTPRSRASAGVWVSLSYLALGLAALLPRVLALGQYITDDEANFWLTRSDVFLKAMRSGDFAATAITAHPGVTTMWLGAAGILLRRALLGWGLLQSDAFPVVLAFFRLPVVLVHMLVILLGYGLLRRMFRPQLALLGALLWALDPFVIGYSRLLHTDALAGSFMTLSVLAACAYWNHQRRAAWLSLSAVSAGLAFLSKSPALILLPAVGMLALMAQTQDGSWELRARGARAFVAPLLAWGALAALTVFALWPALWVSPLQAYDQLRVGVEVEGAQPHMLGNFFLGRADDAPGLLYYPVALALRTTPWTLLGLLTLPFALRSGSQKLERRDLAALAGFALLFVAAMSVFPKKFDRYMVPAFPALDILAAAGLLGISDFGFWILKYVSRRSNSQLFASTLLRGTEDKSASALRLPSSSISASKIQLVVVALMTAAALANVAYWHPYSTLAFNQALGGAPAGARTFFMGWGEGLDQAAAWLNARPDITGVRTVALRITSLNPYLREGAQADFPKGDQLRPHTGYVVVYLPQVQDGHVDGAFDQFYRRAPPLHVVRIHGVDMAWIYQGPNVAQARAARFGPDIRLFGFDQAGAPQRGQALSLRLAWGATTRPPADYWLFAHLIGPDGRRYAQLDLPCSSSQWVPGQFAATDLPLALPADAPAGIYRLLVGLYDQASGQRLPLATEPGTPPPAEPDAFVLTQFDLR